LMVTISTVPLGRYGEDSLPKQAQVRRIRGNAPY